MRARFTAGQSLGTRFHAALLHCAFDAHPGNGCREELEYVANTLIFVLSGVIITGKIWESSATRFHEIQAADYGYAVLLWIYLLVGRPCVCRASKLLPPHRAWRKMAGAV